MTVEAKDKGVSPFATNVDVIIDIDRNQNSPIFDNLPHVLSPGINEDILASAAIFDVDAQDADTVVS